MQITNNIAAFNVLGNYTSNVTDLRNSMSKFFSSRRINNAGDDLSGFAMSEYLFVQARYIAKETVDMIKFQILQQVGTAMLARANQLSQGVFKFLG